MVTLATVVIGFTGKGNTAVNVFTSGRSAGNSTKDQLFIWGAIHLVSALMVVGGAILAKPDFLCLGVFMLVYFWTQFAIRGKGWITYVIPPIAGSLACGVSYVAGVWLLTDATGISWVSFVGAMWPAVLGFIVGLACPSKKNKE